MQKLDKIVVTRHRALYDYLVSEGYVEPGTKFISKVDKEDIEGKHVFGVLPNWLACNAALFTEVQFRLPYEKKGKELSLEDMKFLTYAIRTYKITEVSYERKRMVSKDKKSNAGYRDTKGRK